MNSDIAINCKNEFSIIVVDDEPLIRDFIYEFLHSEGYTVHIATNIQDALELIEKDTIHLCITDLKMPGGSGKTLIQNIRSKSLQISIIIITAHPDEETVKFADEWSIQSLLVKPFTVKQLKYSVLQSIHAIKFNTDQNQQHSQSDGNTYGLIGESQYIKDLRKKVKLLGNGNFPVLIQGESGTGKEIVAHALHSCSNRNTYPLLTVNCAAIPHHLEEAEFFGYVRGAFTGAHSMKHGIFASADKSTLFLDEIGEMSLQMQAKLLRVLDTGEFKRIGENFPRIVDVRIISATNRDLEVMVKNGTFRQDLYFRLKGAVIETEPLSKHPEDIPSLIRHFNSMYSEKTGTSILTSGALNRLVHYSWPGNVRELRHVVEYLTINCRGLNKINVAAISDVLCLTDDSFNETEITYNEAKES
ncbi:MAG: sigma-54-dependent Fis family transcriptional regulator, partial [Fibrobacter sp.]|nr:sigma-54-dependent Fis family transcriptional regulator [Fibrobacter sp.]